MIVIIFQNKLIKYHDYSRVTGIIVFRTSQKFPGGKQPWRVVEYQPNLANRTRMNTSIFPLPLCFHDILWGDLCFYITAKKKKTLKRTSIHSKSQNSPLYKIVVLQHQNSTVVTVHCSAPPNTTNILTHFLTTHIILCYQNLSR
jgi:hypothetical protein